MCGAHSDISVAFPAVRRYVSSIITEPLGFWGINWPDCRDLCRSFLKPEQARGTLARVLTHRCNIGLTLLVLASFVSGVGCVRGKKKELPAGAVSAPPKIEIVEKMYNFGNATEGDRLTHVFKLKNSGTGPLLIDRVTTSCGCTAAVLKNKEVLPGGEGEIEVTFDTNRRGGDNHKTITILSNDPNNPRAELEIRANVETLLAFDPGFIRLNPEIGKQQVTEAWLTGKLKEQAKLKILDASSDPEVSVELADKKTDNGGNLQGIRFKITGKKVGLGNGNLTLETGLPKPDKLQIGFHWAVTGNLQVAPAQLYFSPRSGSAAERVIRVSSRKTDFRLREARVETGPFTARIVTPDAGVGYEVHVTLKKDIEPAPTAVTEIGKLELISNDPLEPKKEIPLRLAPQFSPPGMRGAPGGTRPMVPPATPPGR